MGSVVRKVTGSSKPKTASKPADVTTTAAAKGAEDTEVSDIETESGMMQKKKKGKKALKLSPASANVGGEGASGLNIPTS